MLDLLLNREQLAPLQRRQASRGCEAFDGHRPRDIRPEHPSSGGQRHLRCHLTQRLTVTEPRGFPMTDEALSTVLEAATSGRLPRDRTISGIPCSDIRSATLGCQAPVKSH